MCILTDLRECGLGPPQVRVLRTHDGFEQSLPTWAWVQMLAQPHNGRRLEKLSYMSSALA